MARWDDPASNPIEDIRRARKMIEKDVGLPEPSYYYISQARFDSLLESPEGVAELADIIQSRWGFRPREFVTIDGRTLGVPK